MFSSILKNKPFILVNKHFEKYILDAKNAYIHKKDKKKLLIIDNSQVKTIEDFVTCNYNPHFLYLHNFLSISTFMYYFYFKSK